MQEVIQEEEKNVLNDHANGHSRRGSGSGVNGLRHKSMMHPTKGQPNNPTGLQRRNTVFVSNNKSS